MYLEGIGSVQFTEITGDVRINTKGEIYVAGSWHKIPCQAVYVQEIKDGVRFFDEEGKKIGYLNYALV